MWTPRLTDEIIEREVRIRNPELFHSVLRRGKGLILMTGHFGNWEWMSVGTARILGHPYTVVVHSIHNSSVDALVEYWRTMHGNRVVPMGVAIREIVRTLRERGVVAMIADQSGPSGAYYVRFFGRHAATYEGPAVFALKTGAPIIFGFSVRQPDGSYALDIEELPMKDLKGSSEENIQELTRRHVRALERAVRAHPDHWLWQHKRWKHTPHEGSILIEDPPEH
jgi:KDO2-lipid IV(A) lauroyltransferase